MSSRTFSDQQIIDAYVCLIARYIVIRQEHIDLAEDGVDYNTIKFNELGRAEFVSPNLDVAYLECWIAVDENTPVILTVPRVEGRYYTAQIIDGWGEIVTNINERTYPEYPYGDYALCLAGSEPVIPEGALRVDIPSKKVKLLARVERMGDDSGAVALQQAFRVTPVGAVDIEPAIPIAMFKNEGLMGAEIFDVPALTEALATSPDSVAGTGRFRDDALAIADYVAASEENRDEIDAVCREQAVPALIRFAMREGGDNRHGWGSTRGEFDAFGEDIFLRAAVNFGGLWLNMPSEVIYYVGMTTTDGDFLHGDKLTTIHYAADDLPDHHVDAYWSLTMLSLPDYRVVPNRLDRYNLNNVSDLAYGDDGSLTLYLSAECPRGTPESNWLPAPAGKRYSLNHRFYVPKHEVISGDWYAAPLVKQTTPTRP
jgi:hypothetical protein